MTQPYSVASEAFALRAENARLRDSLARTKAAHDRARQILGADVESIEDAAARVVRELAARDAYIDAHAYEVRLICDEIGIDDVPTTAEPILAAIRALRAGVSGGPVLLCPEPDWTDPAWVDDSEPDDAAAAGVS